MFDWLSKVPAIIQTYPAWVQGSVVVWIVSTAILIAVLVTVRPTASSGTEVDHVVEHLGSRDPESEGFVEFGEFSASAVFNAQKTGYEAWQVETPHTGYYFRKLNSAQKKKAYEKGWSLTAEMKLVDGLGYVLTDFVGVGRRFDINVQKGAGNDLVVWLTTAIDAGWRGPKHTLVDGAGVYHQYQLLYDADLKRAQLLVDGQEVGSDPQLRDYRGHTEHQEDRGVAFGAALYQSDRGVAAFKNVKFEILR
jgi:hypothetical protein